MAVEYYYEFSWRVDSLGGETRISGGPFSAKEERDERFVLALYAARYAPPKWWQYWRWGEPTPSVFKQGDDK